MADYCKVPEFKVTFKSNISLPSYENFYLLLEECEAVSRGFDMGSIESYQKEIKSASKDWILLFQMDTVESDDYELMFGDCGHIYFWIKKEDLANKNFENIWLILQCY